MLLLGAEGIRGSAVERVVVYIYDDFYDGFLMIHNGFEKMRGRLGLVTHIIYPK